MTKRPITPQALINLLGKLKGTTPDYPADLMAARKAAFLKHIATLPKPPGGETGGGGSGGGGSGSGGESGLFGGMSTAQGILVQATIGVWVVAAMATTAYAFRDKIADLLQDNGTVNAEMTQESPIELSAPVVTSPPTEIPPTEPPTAFVSEGPDGVPVEVTPEGPASVQEEPDAKKDKGKHLGQTPGPPDSPGHNNKPEKLDRPDKPGKPKKNEK